MIDAGVREVILDRLRAVEAGDHVRILYAVESGSRAWGFPSRDSDYDVRFIYVRPLDWYLSIDVDVRRDVIEKPIADEIDLSGWDVRKALGLFAKSNPPLLEWLSSPIVYNDASPLAQQLRALAPAYFAPRTCLNHYYHMAQSNYRGDQHVVSLKKYFYVLRPLLAMRWIEQGRGPAPMVFTDLLATIADQPDLVADIMALRQRKLAGEEADRAAVVPVISEFIAAEMARERVPAERPTPPDFEPLNALFRSFLSPPN